MTDIAELQKLADNPYANDITNLQRNDRLIQALQGLSQQRAQLPEKTVKFAGVDMPIEGANSEPGWMNIVRSLSSAGAGYMEGQAQTEKDALVKALAGREQAERAKINAPVVTKPGYTTPGYTTPGGVDMPPSEFTQDTFNNQQGLNLQGATVNPFSAAPQQGNVGDMFSFASTPQQAVAPTNTSTPMQVPATSVPATSRLPTNEEKKQRMLNADPTTSFGRGVQDAANKAQMERLFAGPVKLGQGESLVDPNTDNPLGGGSSNTPSLLFKELKDKYTPESIVKVEAALRAGKSPAEAMALAEPIEKLKTGELGPGVSVDQRTGKLYKDTKEISAETNQKLVENSNASKRSSITVANTGPKVEESRQVEGSKIITAKLVESHEKVIEANETLQTIKQMKQAISNGVYSGYGANTKLSGARILAALGVPVDENKTGNSEYLESLLTANLKQFKAIFGPQVSNSDIIGMAKGTGRLSTTPEGLMNIMNNNEAVANRVLQNNQTLNKAYIQYSKDHDIAKFFSNTEQQPLSETPKRRAGDKPTATTDNDINKLLEKYAPRHQ